jgi:hypothetical protein
VSLPVPVSLTSIKPRWKNIGVFRFHTKVENVPADCVQNNLREVIVLYDLGGLSCDQPFNNRLNLVYDVIPAEESSRGPFCDARSELTHRLKADVLPSGIGAGSDRFFP